MIMSTGRETSSSDHRNKSLKPCTRGLLKAVERVMKTTDRAICNIIPRWWLHINLLTQLTIKKDILSIKMRHGPMANRCHGKKSPNSGHVSHRSKSLIIIIDMLLLKATSDQTSFVTLKGPTCEHEEEEGRSPTHQCAQAQQSPQPWRAAIQDEHQPHDK
jgi:hypothetical protein